MSNTLIFDIGKTNKKWCLFDSEYKVLDTSQVSIDEITDDDGYPCDDLAAIEKWMKGSYDHNLRNKVANISLVNFSSYGASLVHIDKDGIPLTPLYNYLKPIPEDILERFYKTYDDVGVLARTTASPQLGMLNSGLQLYWLKYTRPEVFGRIKWTIHLPQYLSYLFTGIPVSDYTSIGCHTGLWDFQKKNYHEWVCREGFDLVFPPIVNTNTSYQTKYENRNINFGVGIHDSSAALIPYLMGGTDPFVLLSTGTWSIALNPFSKGNLTSEDLAYDCLNYLRFDGSPVRAARLFLGNEYAFQVEKLQDHFARDRDASVDIKFDESLYKKLSSRTIKLFRFESIKTLKEQPDHSNLKNFNTFEEAIHQLMIELVDLQVDALYRALEGATTKKIFVDGGFANNGLFVPMLSLRFPDTEICTLSYPQGAALGAAMVLSTIFDSKYDLNEHFEITTWRGGSMI